MGFGEVSVYYPPWLLSEWKAKKMAKSTRRLRIKDTSRFLDELFAGNAALVHLLGLKHFKKIRNTLELRLWRENLSPTKARILVATALVQAGLSKSEAARTVGCSRKSIVKVCKKTETFGYNILRGAPCLCEGQPRTQTPAPHSGAPTS